MMDLKTSVMENVISTAINKHEEKNHPYSKVIIMAFVIVLICLAIGHCWCMCSFCSADYHVEV